MADKRTRIAPVDVDTVPDDIKAAFEGQKKLWGAPLLPHLFYAHNPSQGLWKRG